MGLYRLTTVKPYYKSDIATALIPLHTENAMRGKKWH